MFKEETEISFKEICDDLDKQHEKYLSWKMETYNWEEIWESFLNRKNTFLTRK